jgi:hypothetical protein
MMMSLRFWQRFLLIVIAVPALIQSVPEAKAFQSNRNTNNNDSRQKQQHRTRPQPSTTRSKEPKSMPSLRSTIAFPIILTREQEVQDQKNRNVQDVTAATAAAAVTGRWSSRINNFSNTRTKTNLLTTASTTTSLTIPIDRILWSGTGLVLVGAAYSLTKTRTLSSIVRYTTLCLQTVFLAYQRALLSSPLRTKVATGAILAILGDALAQSTTASSTSSSLTKTSTTFVYDKRRALSFAAFDSCYRIFQHFMFPAVITLCQGNVLNKFVPSILLPMTSALERTLLYQLLIVPVSLCCVMFCCGQQCDMVGGIPFRSASICYCGILCNAFSYYSCLFCLSVLIMCACVCARLCIIQSFLPLLVVFKAYHPRSRYIVPKHTFSDVGAVI